MKHKRRSRKYKKREQLVDPVSWAIAGAHQFPAATVAGMIEPITQALNRLAFATADRDDWNLLASAFNISEALADVGICADLMPDVEAGMAVLHTIALDHFATGTWRLSAEHTRTLGEAVETHRIQISLCTQGEHSRACQRCRDLLNSGAMIELAKLYVQLDKTPKQEAA